MSVYTAKPARHFLKGEYVNELKQTLDAIDKAVLEAARPSYLEAAKTQAKGMIDKGKAILEKYPGVKDEKAGRHPKYPVIGTKGGGGMVPISYREVGLETDRKHQDIKKWVLLAKKYPSQKYAQEWIDSKAETQTQKYIEGSTNSLVDKMTGNSENYTPKEIIDAVREVMGGIDIDPATCVQAQKIVQAKKYYTQKDNGLEKQWEGTVFLNPPYGMPDIKQFTEKLIQELPNIESAILLTNDQTDTLWFQSCAIRAKLICFTTGRIGFYTPTKVKTAPTNGQAFMYFGKNENAFKKVFAKIGLIVRPVID
jgi:phage N-6-adenine-methyltransferase